MAMWVSTRSRVPLNYKGFSPGANVSLAWQFTPTWSAQVTLAGSFLMFMINMRIQTGIRKTPQGFALRGFLSRQ